MSWCQRAAALGGGFELFSNRDELRRRAQALPPCRQDRDGVAFLAPRDPDGGGTWITVNVFGLALCLLNHYQGTVQNDPRSLKSRGLLVRDLATARDRKAVERAFDAWDLTVYRPFTLLVLTPQEATRSVLRWDGISRSRPAVGLPLLTSSSVDPEGADASRRELWRQLELDDQAGAERFLDLHSSHLPERGPRSPCMHREDARTVSLTRVTVTANAVRMAHGDGPPCRTPLSSPLELRRHPDLN